MACFGVHAHNMAGCDFYQLAMQLIVEALLHNNAIQTLYLPHHYSEDARERVRLSVEEVNKKRESCECQVKLKVTYWF